jgi:hypothetical protein
MNTDQLLDAMADADPSPDAVLDLVRRKRRAARNRVIYAATSGLVVVVAVVAVVLHSVSPAAQSSRTASGGASSGSAAVAPAASGLSSGPVGGPASRTGDFGMSPESGACTQATLAQVLAAAVRSGASVIVGSATLASSPGHAAASGSATYYRVTLGSVRTLAGPAVAPGSTAWITGASPGASTSQAAVAPAGQLFGIVYRSAGSGLPGPVLAAAVVVSGQVILSSDGCWDATASPAGSPPGIAQRSASASRPATAEIPLATAERLATDA